MRPKEVFDPYVFPWIQVTLTRDEIATRICRLAMLIGTPEQTDRAIDFMDAMDPSNRPAYLHGLMMKPTTRKQVRFLVDSMSDRSEAVRDIAIGIVKKINRKGLLTEDDYATMRDNLRLKAAGMRIATISILADLPEKEAEHNARLLLNDKSADRRLAALDMIRILPSRFTWFRRITNITLKVFFFIFTLDLVLSVSPRSKNCFDNELNIKMNWKL